MMRLLSPILQIALALFLCYVGVGWWGGCVRAYVFIIMPFKSDNTSCECNKVVSDILTKLFPIDLETSGKNT